MFAFLRRHLLVLVAGVLGAMIAAAGPTVARAVYDAVNADKVDGKHAVSSGASIAVRKGKLVATNTQTGQLPNNIIAKAPDAARLNGYTHAKLRVQPLPVQGVATSGGASIFTDGFTLAGTGDGTIGISFLVPPDHPSGTPLFVDLVYGESSNDACDWYTVRGGTTGPINGTFYNGGWQALPDNDYDGPIHVAAGTDSGHTQVFRWPFAAAVGNVIEFRLSRVADNPLDTCTGAITVYGMQLRY